MQLSDPLPESFAREFAELSQNGDMPDFCCRGDLDSRGQFGEAYVAVNAKRVIAFDPYHEPLHLPMDRIKEAKVDELFGASRLMVVTDEGERKLVQYTRNMVGEFSALCRVINELRQGHPPTLPEELEKATCPKCAAPLPERGATCPLCLSRTGIFLRLVQLLRPYRPRVVLLVTSACLSVGAAMIPPYTYKLIADRALNGGHHGELALWVGVMLAAFLAQTVFQFITDWNNTWLAARVVADMRSRLHAQMQRLRMSYHNKRESGELVGRVMNDTGELLHFLIDGLPFALVNCVSFVAIAVILLSMNWKLALMVFVPVPLLIFGGGWFWKHLRPMFHKRSNRYGVLHTILGESLRGVRTVKSMAQEDRRVGEFNHANERLFHSVRSLEQLFFGFFGSMSLFMALGTVLVWYFGGQAIIAGESKDGPPFQLGTLLAFVGYIGLFYGPLKWFAAIFNWMSNAFASAERIFAVLDQPTEVYDAPEAVTLPQVKGAIEFRDVRFSYERGKEVIKGISLKVEPGTMVGLVGKSGAGKSTIINLVCRFYDPDAGAVLVDGHDLRKLKLDSWRKQVGIVMQEPFLFNASLLENIRYGSPDAGFADVVRAAKAAKAHEFICEKDEGYDTVVGEGGAQLSGGERQRIAIARAILHNPPVLILDEATSAVDSETEKHIQEAIARLIEGRTTIAIAHRLATLRNAHRLLVVEDGKIVEEGTHEELLRKPDGHFAKLVKLQSDINRMRAEQNVWQE